MEITERYIATMHKIIGLKCDVCKKEYNDEMDIQEFIRLKQRSGYSSIIGDDIEWNIDICEKCFVEKFGKYINGTKKTN